MTSLSWAVPNSRWISMGGPGIGGGDVSSSDWQQQQQKGGRESMDDTPPYGHHQSIIAAQQSQHQQSHHSSFFPPKHHLSPQEQAAEMFHEDLAAIAQRSSGGIGGRSKADGRDGQHRNDSNSNRSNISRIHRSLAASDADWAAPRIAVTNYNTGYCIESRRHAFSGGLRGQANNTDNNNNNNNQTVPPTPLRQYPPESLKRNAVSAAFDTISLVDDLLLDVLDNRRRNSPSEAEEANEAEEEAPPVSSESDDDMLNEHQPGGRSLIPLSATSSRLLSLPQGLRKDPNPTLLRRWARRCGVPTHLDAGRGGRGGGNWGSQQSDDVPTSATLPTGRQARGRDGVLAPRDRPSAPIDLSHMAVVQAPLRPLTPPPQFDDVNDDDYGGASRSGAGSYHQQQQQQQQVPDRRIRNQQQQRHVRRGESFSQQQHHFHNTYNNNSNRSPHHRDDHPDPHRRDASNQQQAQQSSYAADHHQPTAALNDPASAAALLKSFPAGAFNSFSFNAQDNAQQQQDARQRLAALLQPPPVADQQRRRRLSLSSSAAPAAGAGHQLLPLPLQQEGEMMVHNAADEGVDEGDDDASARRDEQQQQDDIADGHIEDIRGRQDCIDIRRMDDVGVFQEVIDAVYRDAVIGLEEHQQQQSLNTGGGGGGGFNYEKVLDISGAQLPSFYNMAYQDDHHSRSEHKLSLFDAIKPPKTKAGPSCILFELDQIINDDLTMTMAKRKGRKDDGGGDPDPDEPPNLTVVTELIADNCYLNDDDLALLSHWIKEGKTSLTKISLRNNYFTPVGTALLKKALKYNPNIVELNLDDNWGLMYMRGDNTKPNKEGHALLKTIGERIENNRRGKSNIPIMMKLRGRSRSVPKRASSRS